MEPMDDDEMNRLIERQGELTEQIEHMGGWEIDSKLERAMDALQCPPSEQKVKELSGGERRRVALCRLLLQEPDVLLLDEPTKGLDYSSKCVIAKILKELSEEKITILTVTHDIEFACMVSDRCGLLFNGSVVTEDRPEKFFSGKFYSTSIAKASSGYYTDIVRSEDLVKICKQNGKR
jgi:ABC-type multidrug transport system ATPase subunit